MKKVITFAIILFLVFSVSAMARQEPTVSGDRYRTNMLTDQSSNDFDLPSTITALDGQTTSLIFFTQTVENIYADIKCDQAVTVQFVRLPDFFDPTYDGKTSVSQAVTADTAESVSYSTVGAPRVRFEIVNSSGADASCFVAVRGSQHN